ncbi:MAG: WXG100 family type VII secretion target [Oscillospiraceae bacterium]|jgi:uncharacterized protein YukE|nr:WXG100 family type VII secretion target [Oscillospiraceae bacterium]
MAQDNTINVSTATLRATSAAVATVNTNLKDKLEEIQKKVSYLCDNTWQSDAGEEVQHKIEAFKTNHFQQYFDVVESYCKFLLITADSYETTEQTLLSNAAAFKD